MFLDKRHRRPHGPDADITIARLSCDRSKRTIRIVGKRREHRSPTSTNFGSQLQCSIRSNRRQQNDAPTRIPGPAKSAINLILNELLFARPSNLENQSDFSVPCRQLLGACGSVRTAAFPLASTACRHPSRQLRNASATLPIARHSAPDTTTRHGTQHHVNFPQWLDIQPNKAACVSIRLGRVCPPMMLRSIDIKSCPTRLISASTDASATRSRNARLSDFRLLNRSNRHEPTHIAIRVVQHRSAR